MWADSAHSIQELLVRHDSGTLSRALSAFIEMRAEGADAEPGEPRYGRLRLGDKKTCQLRSRSVQRIIESHNNY